MTANAAMFLFFAAAVIAVFAFLSVAVWVSGPAQERKARDRLALLKTIAEQPGENAARVLETLLEDERRREARRKTEEKRSYLVGGFVTIAVGVGLGVLMHLLVGGAYWAIGLISTLIGCVLVVTGLMLPRGNAS